MGDSIVFKHTGDFSATLKFFNKLANKDYRNILDIYGRKGVQALSEATPKDSGLTSESWTYEIVEKKNKSFVISWMNTNNVANKRGYEYNLVVLIEYGHATKSGSWVDANPFVEKTMSPILDKLTEALVEELNN